MQCNRKISGDRQYAEDKASKVLESGTAKEVPWTVLSVVLLSGTSLINAELEISASIFILRQQAEAAHGSPLCALVSPLGVDLNDYHTIEESELHKGDVITAIVPASREVWISWKVKKVLQVVHQHTSTILVQDKQAEIIQQLANISLKNAAELEQVAATIYHTVLEEPHYSGDFADIVFALCNEYPIFPLKHGSEETVNFKYLLLLKCQNEFEARLTSLELTQQELDDIESAGVCLRADNPKNRFLTNVKFIGNLFIRKLVAMKVIGQVVHQLIGIREELPKEHMIEGTCELLQVVGCVPNKTRNGQSLMLLFCNRLIALKNKKLGGQFDHSYAFSERIRFHIQEILDLPHIQEILDHPHQILEDRH